MVIYSAIGVGILGVRLKGSSLEERRFANCLLAYPCETGVIKPAVYLFLSYT